MNSEDEIRFAKDRQKLQLILGECVDTAAACLGLKLVGYSHHLAALTGPLFTETISGQQIVMSWTFQVGSHEKKLELAIGHTGPSWSPVVTITDDQSRSDAVVLNGREWPEQPVLRGLIVRSMKDMAPK